MLARLVALTAILVSAGGDGQPLLWLHCGQWLQLPGRDGVGIKTCLGIKTPRAARHGSGLPIPFPRLGRENVGLY